MKRYSFIVEQSDDGEITALASNDGFTSLELLGILSMKMLDIQKQTLGEISPDKIKREIIEK